MAGMLGAAPPNDGSFGMSTFGAEKDGGFIPSSFGADGGATLGVSLGIVGTVGFGDVYAAWGGGTGAVESTEAAPFSAFSRRERSISFLRSFSSFLRSKEDKLASFASPAKASDAAKPCCTVIRQANANPSALLLDPGHDIEAASPSLPSVPLVAARADVDKRALPRPAAETR